MTEMDTLNVSIEDEILANLFANENYARSITPYVKSEYFEDGDRRVIFTEYDKFMKKYSAVPTFEALVLEIDARRDISQESLSSIKEKLGYVRNLSKRPEVPDQSWLMETTEKYCKDRAVYLAVMEAINIMDGEETKKTKNMIPELLSDALAVSFDEHIGHDFLMDASDRWDFYHKKEKRLSFMLDWLNRITSGGIPRKTLTCFLAGTNVGKTLVKCHLAADFLMKGQNVLYVTLEMAEERISERIDANLMDIALDDMKLLPKDLFMRKVEDIRAKTTGKLFVKEYPTASAHVGHLRHLLRELRMKEKFVPDVIFIDYLNICASSRIRSGENTYIYVKAIAEELRGLAVEQNVAIITSTQTNRDGWNSSDLELSNTSESAGLPATVDLMIGLIVTDQLKQIGQIMFKQLKNRFSDVTRNVKHVFNIDRAKMKLAECEDPMANVEASAKSSPQNKHFPDKTDTPPWELPAGGKKANQGDPFADFKF